MTTLNQHYGPAFYDRFTAVSASSSAVCVPLIVDLLKPSSVIDVGCGIGEWLRQFELHGVQDYLGIDGEHVQEQQLAIPADRFTKRDLSQPLVVPRRFDLAMSVEVAEHLPKASAAQFVRGLTALAPAVVFSAALPGQGGINHINEQWPWYWQELFAECGYVRLDPFRPAIWQNDKVAFYYQQNLFLFVDPSAHPALISKFGLRDSRQELTLVKTSILHDLTLPGPVGQFFSRAWNRVRKFVGLTSARTREGKTALPNSI